MGVLLKSFTSVSGFTEEIPPSALMGSHLPFQGRLLQKKHFCTTSSAAMSKPSGGIRSLHSLSAWGLPTPIVVLAGIGNVDIQVFSGAGGQFYLIQRLQVFASLEKGGEPPLGGGGIRPRSATSSAAMSKPSGGIRSFLAVRLWLANAGGCLCLYL